LSHKDFDDLTPKELDFALRDADDYRNIHDRISINLIRLLTLIQRNKAVKQHDMIRDPAKFYPLPWDTEPPPPETPDWNELDRKYGGVK
jgi:hypothetical protein